MNLRHLFLTVLMCCQILTLSAQNPYLPLWEYIPDGEPYIFEDPDAPGKYRVYVYGSHDISVDMYCGRNQVVWSAPVEDLSAWRYDGIIFKSDKDADGQLLSSDGRGDVLYAPDVTVRTDSNGNRKYYLYPNNQETGRRCMAASSDRPDGPFTVINWSKENPRETEGILDFDPAVFVDDDGRVYGYWGFGTSCAAEFDPETMCSVKPGTEVITGLVSGFQQEGVFRFYEASSMRKIEDKYVFVYSRTTAPGEFGLPASNYTLAYAYGDSPLGPFTYGGTLIDGRARGLDENGNVICTANPYGNTHGSIIEIGGRWWVFYHRQTGTDEYSRQAMVAPIEVSVEKGKGGKVTISEGEYNSEGFRTEGLDPLLRTPAGIACHLTNPDGIRQEYPHFIFTGSYIKSTRYDSNSLQGPFNQKIPFCPVVNNTAGSVVGYKYFNFKDSCKELVLDIVPEGVKGEIIVMVGGPSVKGGGKKIASVQLTGKEQKELVKTSVSCSEIPLGKQSLYFVFESAEKDQSLCELHALQFR